MGQDRNMATKTAEPKQTEEPVVGQFAIQKH